ncbi:N-acetyl-alpha-D-glucosaminyl-diphospho-ditrans, octacis-undecaprenol 3-alpha-mannosyltransferase/rhamnosyltransferase [Methylomarinovum caldicuralii]|uniref:N-acetyl-alpha-D-glucosaminyl-diphospho-ditrans, octacis-undecaprenol 3-alpha-mannosyltransferase/rhamnosyltransferase n=2 Tax=Methylomarinovum caldicuralii TaxID=438856 RepID=A0AAU9C8Y6_9GAMM|nr:N-acetyl-alpha-D-glucosaminyl-diphospho-ditrans, octacis-undecaprenol 3-alpha-mannosyltransferase/rhamnosyltransferase [Methylomarinovum caldicuralii]
MEQFLGDLLPALQREGIEPAALVHAHNEAERREKPFPLWRVPSWGRLLYAPVSPAYPQWLAKMIQSFHPDLLHIHLPNPSAFWTLALPAVRRIPWIIHWHADVVASEIDTRLALAYRLYRPLEQALLRHSAKIITTSPPYRDSSEPLKTWRAKTEVVPLGIDPGRLPPPDAADLAWAEAQWQSGILRALCLGRLTYYKGHRVLLEAVARCKDIHLICVGGGELLEELEHQIRQRSLQDRVRLAGQLPERQRNALLASCDVLVLPSVERTEAFGLVLLEAMAYGKPVIATRVPGSGMGWVVENGETGLLVKPDDAAALAQAFDTVREYPGRRGQMGEAGRARLEQRFHIRACARHLARIYQTIRG